MSDDRLLASYLRVAREAAKAAELLAGAGNRGAANSAFQAAENLVYAVLVAENVDLSALRRGGARNHHLEDFVAALPEANVLRGDLFLFAELSAYATTYRYPTAAGRIPPAPPAALLDRQLRDLASLIAECMEEWGVDPDPAATGPARARRPARWARPRGSPEG